MKKVAYKIKKRLGGSVIFRNIEVLDESRLVKIEKLMENYGFLGEDRAVWEDFLMPDGPDSADIGQLASYVPIEVKTTLSAKGKPKFRVSIDESEASTGKDLTETICKAHGKWNREGRPLRGVQLEEALAKKVAEVNKGLGL